MANSAQADTLSPQGTSAPPGSTEPLADLAARYKLTVSGARPGLLSYTRQLWARRHFIVAFANAKTRATYSTAKLGQVWQVLTPLMNAAVYYLIFGYLVQTKDGIDNYVAFLVTGVFVFTFTQSAVLAGSRAISDQLNLIRALHFPRACLPISFTIVQLQQLMFSMVVLCAIVLGTGEPLTLKWLLVLPALVLQFVFNVGLSLVLARIGAVLVDIKQLLPFLLRTWLYLSGVFYSLDSYTDKAPAWVARVLEANPGAVYIEVIRDSLIESHQTLPLHVWGYAVGWALVMGIGGYVYFWKAEERYGRG
ncbi:ABC transporter permease [Embleya sp. NPDC050154]|uniref:ABC transporter permease n=1 Tax=unclassified Embleya TaxID=2699296 RepID=UPI0037B5A340